MDSLLHLHLQSGLLLVVKLLDVASDGACFFHCIIAFFLQFNQMNRRHHVVFPLDAKELRRFLCQSLYELKEVSIPGLGESPLSFFETEYGTRATKRKHLHNSVYNSRLIEIGEDPFKNPLYVNSFEDYVSWMTHPNTQVDGLMVAFSAFFLNVNLTIYTRSMTEVQESSDVPGVMQLISMGFPKSAAENVLSEMNGNVDAAIEKLIRMDSTQPEPSQRKPEIWKEQPYHFGSPLSISMMNNHAHFQLIVPQEEQQSVQPEESRILYEIMSMGFSREKAEQALLEANGDMQVAVEKLLSLPRVMLPDMSDDLLESPKVELALTREQFYNFCNNELKSSFSGPPPHLRLGVRIEKGPDAHFLRSLFDSFIFPELGKVKYRIVCFRFDDGNSVEHTGTTKELSFSEVKKKFFIQVWGKIALHSVTRIVLERC